MGFKNSTVIDYPVEEVFKVFIRTAKRDFPKFNEKNPIGCGVTKKVGAYSAKTATMRIEITDYKENELYQITSSTDKMVYVSTYTLEKIDESSTKLSSEEIQDTPGAFQFMNTIIQTVLFKRTVRRRFGVFIDSLEKEIEDYKDKVSKAQPKNKEELIDEKSEEIDDAKDVNIEEVHEENKSEE
ncbi:DUF3284 domain-containing protein [uncultured Clostridium sp.]|uniref:DUF3284 domain-containing protein n=1 Tax=uncultured Clostridium sp. TaxID=59620 RepID=UPI00260CAA23|nr:DUF3284 domain-containing protein [uncultured Clostridium sp.]